MAVTIRMRAKVAFTHEGEALRAGQTFSASPVQAAALRYQHKADFIDGRTHAREQRAETLTAPVGASDDAQPAPRARGSYRRRDLRAEDSEKT